MINSGAGTLNLLELSNEITRRRLESSTPFIVLNMASSLDGKIAARHGKRLQISTEDDFRRVHNLRNEMDAILVGTETLLKDDPRLLVKEKYVQGKMSHPARVVLDARGRVSPEKRVFIDDVPVFVATTYDGFQKQQERFEGLEHVVVVGSSVDKDGKLDLSELFHSLGRYGVRSILVEGGSKIFSYLIRNDCFDVLTIFFRSCFIGGMKTQSIIGGPTATNIGEVIHMASPIYVPMKEGMLVAFFSEQIKV